MTDAKNNRYDNIVTEVRNQRAETYADRSKILSDIRHEIRGPMHVIKGLTSILAANDTQTPKQKKTLDNLTSSTDHLFLLIDNMLEFIEIIIKEPEKTHFRRVQLTSATAPRIEDRPYFEADPEEEKPAKSKYCVLVVEDYAPNIFIATSFLTELGYDYDVAHSGQEALVKFSLARYDAILMDVQMPGMDGLEITRRIRLLEKTGNMIPTPIVASTGNANSDDQFFCRRAGMNDYLSKPFLQKDLGNKLQNLVLKRSL